MEFPTLEKRELSINDYIRNRFIELWLLCESNNVEIEPVIVAEVDLPQL